MELSSSPRALWWSLSRCPSPSCCLCPPHTPGVTQEEAACPLPRPLLTSVSMTTGGSGQRSADTGRQERGAAAERGRGGGGGHVTGPDPERGAPGGGERGAGAGAGGGTRTGTSGSETGTAVLGGGGPSPRGARRTGGWPPAATPS